MPILTDQERRKRKYFQLQYTPACPIAPSSLSFDPVSGSSFASGSEVVISAQASGIFTSPLKSIWYLEGEVYTGSIATPIVDLENGSVASFGAFDGPATRSISVRLYNEAGGVDATSVYEIIGDVLTVEISATGTGTGSLLGAGNYIQGQPVSIAALPENGTNFTGWTVVSGDTPANTSSMSTGFTISENTVLEAGFDLKEWQLTLNATGSGTASILWGASYYDTGEIATLTAAAAPSSSFSYYEVVSGDTLTLASGSSDNYVTMSQDTVINAWFTLD